MKLPAQRLLGAGLLSVAICTVALALTGLSLSRVYQPTAEGAYASLQTMSNAYKALQAVHYWLAFFAVLTSGLTIFGMLWYGWWRSARGLWWAALALGLLVYGAQVTGKPLPLTQHDARTMLTEARIAGSAPGLGPAVKDWILPGGTVNDGSLGRWYQLHRWLTGAGSLLVSVGLLVWMWRRKMPVGGYWTLAPLALGLLLAATVGAPTGTPATHQDLHMGGPVAPMWYAVPMHALLKWSQALNPSLGWVGAIAIPTALAIFAFALPFLGRGKWAPVWVRGLGLFGALVVVVAFAQFGSQMQSPASRAAPDINTAMHSGTPGMMDSERMNETMMRMGARLFDEQGCRNCHSLDGKGASGPGPALDGIGALKPSRSWFVSFLKDPAAQGAALMPSYGHLSSEELNALAEFLRAQRKQ